MQMNELAPRALWFGAVCFFLQPYIFSIYNWVKFEKKYFTSWPFEKKSIWVIYNAIYNTIQGNPLQLIEVYLIKNMKGNGGN